MTRVIVGMSGGVDSSVAALLLREAGHEVRGVFMKNYEPLPGSNQPCPWEQDQADVASVCEKLGIPWESWNFEKEYRTRVLEYFFREYEAGRTPNPDVLCNREIKFGVFLQRALAEGFDAVATGHYAQVRQSGGKYQLLVADDTRKDQTYFLHTLGQAELARTYFPIGHLQKSKVRSIAAKAGLSVASKPDSQGICFVGQVNITDFLKGKVIATPGQILTEAGSVVGEHQGLAFYTIGQRHGLGVGGGVPYYVAKKDTITNTLLVARGDKDPVLYASALQATEASWVVGATPAKRFTCAARIRYRQPLEQCTISVHQNFLHVTFTQPQRAITPGQAIVFYDSKVCLGGATIEKAVNY
ncbi:MAG: tRNA 2-thiouridine(34) synthase MnmA [Patescibacteria group bacterium]